MATEARRPPISPSPTAWLSLAPLCVRNGLVSEAASSRWRSPSLRETMRPSMLAKVSTPIPPTSSPSKMMTSPKNDQCVAMFTVERPVTQTDETAVKNASTNGVTTPERVANGNESSPVNRRIIRVKLISANRDGDAVAKLFSQTRSENVYSLCAVVRVLVTRSLSLPPPLVQEVFSLFGCHATRTWHYCIEYGRYLQCDRRRHKARYPAHPA